MTSEKNDTREIKSVRVTFRIFQLLIENDRMGVSELASELDYSKPSIYYYLQTLKRMRYVNKEDNKYYPSLRMLNIGGFALSRHPIYRIAKNPVKELAEKTGYNSILLVEEQGKAFVISEYNRNRSEIANRLGSEQYLHTTGPGKAILAYLSTERREDVISRHGLPQLTSQTITDESVLYSEIESILDMRFAVGDAERRNGYRDIGVPIEKNDQVIGALGISGTLSNLSDPRPSMKAHQYIENEIDVLRETATQIEAKLE